MLSLLSAALLQLTFRDVITGIPHDLGAIIAYAVIGLFIYGVWRGSRGSKTPSGTRA